MKGETILALWMHGGAWLRRERVLVGALFAYLAVAAVLFGSYRYTINPDGVAYMSLARKYADGNFREAVNGYWSPLLPWLLTPVAIVGRNVQAATKLIEILAGLGSIVLVWRILREWRISRFYEALGLVAAVPLAWYWSLPAPLTPDLLMVVAVLAYVLLLGKTASQRGLPSWRLTVMLGVVGALGFYAKSFMLFFFVVHLGLWGAGIWLQAEPADRKTVAKRYAGACAVFGVLLVPWVTALSVKYHQPTISTSGSYNFRLTGPSRQGLHPMETEGLLAPVNATALSVWEDPTHLTLPSWNPLGSISQLQFAYHSALGNTRAITIYFLGFSVFSLGIVLVGVTEIFGRSNRKDPQAGRYRYRIALLVSTVLVYVAGYSILTRDERYFWPCFSLIVIMGILYADFYHVGQGSNGSLSPSRARQWVLRVVVGVVVFSVLLTPIDKVMHMRGQGAWQYEGAMMMKGLFADDARIASDAFGTIDLCYYLEKPCYGKLNPALGDAANHEQLRSFKITDVIITDISPQWVKPAYLAEYQEVPTPYPAVRLLKYNPATTAVPR